MDQLMAMRAFIRVVEAGTFTHAARTLDIPKATITKLIQSLEAHIRTKLLHRTTRRVTVTPDGAAYYERAVRLLADIDELDGSMTSSQARMTGRLRVDMGSAFAVLLLIPALPDFHARYPEIQLDMGVSDRPVDLISENVDCSIRAGKLSDQSLIARRIGELEFIGCAAPSYIERYGAPAHPSELEGNHYVVNYFKGRSGGVRPMVLIRQNERHEVNARYIVAVNDGNAYAAAGAAGLGVLHAPVFLVQEHLANGSLIEVMAGWRAEPIPLYMVYPPNRHISSRVRIFADWVAEQVAKAGLAGRGQRRAA